MTRFARYCAWPKRPARGPRLRGAERRLAGVDPNASAPQPGDSLIGAQQSSATRDGTLARVFEPEDLLARLCARGGVGPEELRDTTEAVLADQWQALGRLGRERGAPAPGQSVGPALS
jgi:hypothetical protein